MLTERVSGAQFVLNGRGLIVFSDIDYTQVYAPPALGTMFLLLRGGPIILPPIDQPLQYYKPNGRYSAGFNWVLHHPRPFTADSELGLERLSSLRQENEWRKAIILSAITGRYPELHEMTLSRLREVGRSPDYFKEDDIYLNNLISASRFKELKAEEAIKRGYNVVLIDDDLIALLRVARLQALCQDRQTVFACMINNIANHPKLLTWAGVELPFNVLRVDSFDEAAIDIGKMVYAGMV